VDSDRICGAIELTRFPVPEEEDYAETDTEAGLLRAADLIGQSGDPLYARKLNALFNELGDRLQRASRLCDASRSRPGFSGAKWNRLSGAPSTIFK
jgi:hypothetical protein